MDNRMFFITFPNVAYALQYFDRAAIITIGLIRKTMS